MKKIPKPIIITQIILAILLIVTILVMFDGGMFTTFYAVLIFCIAGVACGIFCLFKKSYLIAVIDVLIAIIMFLTYLLLA